MSNSEMGNNNLGDAPDPDEEEILAMKARVAEMEAEAAKLREMQSELSPSHNSPNDPSSLRESKEDVDNRSIFVGNVDYAASPEEIQAHFGSCGAINRVTILLDKFTGNPKGYAYVEFSEPNLVSNALVLNDSEFRGRPLKVTPKRTNLPGMHRGRGRGGYGGGYDRGGYGGGHERGGYDRGGYGGGYAPRGRGGYDRGGYDRGGYDRGGYQGQRGGYNPRGGYRGGRGGRGRGGYAPY